MSKARVLGVLLVSIVSELSSAAECARGSTPAATLLVPYFRVSRNGVSDASASIPDVLGQTDTLMSLTNTSITGVLVHAVVWTKYGVPVLSFMVPLTGSDVATFRMKDVLNGNLNINGTTQARSSDACGIDVHSGVYAPSTGFGFSKFVRFPNPDPADARRSVSIYATPAFSGSARQHVWDALDESGDVRSFVTPGSFIVDGDTSCPGAQAPDGSLSSDFSGYVTFDVVNYCTSFLPTDRDYYVNEALATAGWGRDNGGPGDPNAIIGDYFYIGTDPNDPHVSGESMVALRFLPELGGWVGKKTFYGRYDGFGDMVSAAVPSAYQFIGDGREALGTRYGFRYLDDADQAMRSWATVWRTDRYGGTSGQQPGAPVEPGAETDLCHFWSSYGARGTGTYETGHQLFVYLYDADENEFVAGAQGSLAPYYTFLETQRLDLSNAEINPAQYKGGWIDVSFPGSRYEQAFVGVQHTGRGSFLSVGHAASVLDPASCSVVAPASTPAP